MKKAIKITQQNIDNNQHLFKGKNVNDIIIYTDKNFPKVFNNGTVNFNSDLPDFLNVVEPTLNEGQQIDNNLNNGIIDLEAGTFTYAVKDIPQPTADELYNNLIEQSKQTYDDFRKLLIEASTEALILGEPNENIKTLTRILKDEKVRIDTVLLEYLNNNNIQELQNFSFDTPEAEQFRIAIESFK